MAAPPAAVSSPPIPGPDAPTGDGAPSAFEIQVPKAPGSIAFAFKVRRTGEFFRVVPARRPGEPRFWCFWVYRCLRGGAIDPIDPPWIGGGRMTREELAPAARAILADLDGWLGADGQHALRCWILTDPGAGGG